MKIRNGFVSNSSSSSFVVAFPKKVRSIEQVRDLLFDKDQRSYGGYYDDDGGYSVWEVAETVFNDAQRDGPLKGKALAEALEGYLIHGEGELRTLDIPEPKRPHWEAGDAEWDAYNAAMDEYQLAVAKVVMAKYPDAFFYNFHYGDEDGSYFSALEHGDLFHKLPYIRISHH